jgi:hypothetical protein
MNSKNNTRIEIIINLIRGDRTVRTILLALVLIVVMGSLRPDKILGMYQKRFWATKISWHNYADVVVTGDSRVLGGISPGRMGEILKNRRIVNYGFASNMYVPEYLEGVEQVLKKQSDKKTIILGITPHSLTEDPDITGQFLDLKNLSRQDIYIDIHFAGLMSFFDYMSFRDVLLGIFPRLASSHTYRELFADGWLAYSKKPPGEKRELKKYRKIYERCRVSQKMIENIMCYTSRWNESGIRVYGFLVPTCAQMAELEKELSGFNQTDFIKDFEDAGGIWIEINPTDYDSFDGSHLQRESALELSQELASKINEIERKKDKVFNVE